MKTQVEIERESAQKDYAAQLAEVQDLATMTRTRGWKQVWAKAKEGYDMAHSVFDDAETKPSAFIESMPIFREIMPKTAMFDVEHGTVTIVDTQPATGDDEGTGDE